MRNAAELTLIAFMLIIGIAGVGAFLLYSPRVDVDDSCYGYAIC